MADASDSKSDEGDFVWVQVPSPAYKKPRNLGVFYFHVAFRVASCTDLNHKMLLYCLQSQQRISRPAQFNSYNSPGFLYQIQDS